MSDLIGVLLIALVLLGGGAILAGGILFHERRRKSRARQLAQLADELGLEMSRWSGLQLKRRLPKLPLFTAGQHREVSNALSSSTEEVQLNVFDFGFRSSEGEDSQMFRQTVFLFERKDLDLPAFTLRPRHFQDWLRTLLGDQDVRFETHPGFSHCFLLRGGDEAAIRECFRSETLTELERHPDLAIEGHGRRLAVYIPNCVLPLSEIRVRLGEAYRVMAAFGA